MSVFTQFTGNSPALGSMISLWDYRDNPTIQGFEYLRKGVLKSSAGYETFAAQFPQYAWNVGTNTTYQVINAGPYGSNIVTNGTQYYVATGTTSAVGVTSSLTGSWNSTVSNIASTVIDLFRFGNSGTTTIAVSLSTQSHYITGSTGTAIAAVGYAGAANSAGNLGVICSVASGSGGIYTSTNGTSWTSRTPTGGAGTSILKATWSPVASSFIYLDQNATVFTTTDGFTLTSRGTLTLPGGLTTLNTNPGSQVPLNAAGNASSPTSTIMCSLAGSGGSSQAFYVRTTNGTSFTVYPFSTAFGSAYTRRTAKIAYFNSAYYITFIDFTNLGPFPSIFKSTDDGLTWTPIAKPVNSTSANLYFNFTHTTAYDSVNGNVIITGNNLYAVMNTTETLNFVGVADTSASTGGTPNNSYLPDTYNFVRIK